MKKLILVFCTLAFLVMPLAGEAPASYLPNIEDLVIEGDLQFDLNGVYSVYGIAYPLNVLGHFEVFDKGNDDQKLGDLSLNGQKNYPLDEGWDGTYFGHWAFDPVGCGCDYEIGIFPDLSQFQQHDENMLGFTLLAFNEVLEIEDEIPQIVGSYPPEEGERFIGSPIPIPTSLLLLGSGLLAVVGLCRKKFDGREG